MAPWGHTLPTDHAYFYHHVGPGPVEPVQVFAPAAGRIKFANNNRIDVDVDDEYSYWIGPVVLASGIASGVNVQAGTLLGMHATGAPAFDFSVLRKTQRLNFINPARYSNETLWADGPMKYFEGSVKAQLDAKVLRTGNDLDGKIDYDVAGTLAGNWFAEDLPVSQSAIGGEQFYGTRKLSFARDVYQPHLRRVSIGGLGLTGLYGVNDDSPEFASVTPASGLVVFRLLSPGAPMSPPTDTQAGWLLVQLIDATHLRVEAVPIAIALTFAAGPVPQMFTSGAQIYLR
jgi:hypothetical protein